MKDCLAKDWDGNIFLLYKLIRITWKFTIEWLFYCFLLCIFQIKKLLLKDPSNSKWPWSGSAKLPVQAYLNDGQTNKWNKLLIDNSICFVIPKVRLIGWKGRQPVPLLLVPGSKIDRNFIDGDRNRTVLYFSNWKVSDFAILYLVRFTLSFLYSLWLARRVCRRRTFQRLWFHSKYRIAEVQKKI